MPTWTSEATNCCPHYTDQLKESIMETFKKFEKFLEENRGVLSYDLSQETTPHFPLYPPELEGSEQHTTTLADLEKDTALDILEDFIRPWKEGTAFEKNRDHYLNVLARYNSFFSRLHRASINHLRDTEEESAAYDKIFNLFRSKLYRLVQLPAESIIIWYDRTELWKTKYSEMFPDMEEKIKRKLSKLSQKGDAPSALA